MEFYDWLFGEGENSVPGITGYENVFQEEISQEPYREKMIKSWELDFCSKYAQALVELGDTRKMQEFIQHLGPPFGKEKWNLIF